MKKILSVLAALTLVVSLVFISCEQKKDENAATDDQEQMDQEDATATDDAVEAETTEGQEMEAETTEGEEMEGEEMEAEEMEGEDVEEDMEAEEVVE